MYIGYRSIRLPVYNIACNVKKMGLPIGKRIFEISSVDPKTKP